MNPHNLYRIKKRILAAKTPIAIITVLLASTMLGTVIVRPTIHEPTGTGPHLPVLSEAGSMSYFAKVAGLGYNPPATAHDDNEGGKGDEGGGGPIAQVNSQQLNKDFNQRPRDEPAVTVNPATGTVVGGANDYGIGGPVGGGVYTHLKGASFPAETYFPPFPLLCAGGAGSVCQYEAPPIGTGDPALVYSVKNNDFYYTSIGFAADNCASGVFLYRSLNGLDWTRPIVNRLAGGPATGGGIRTITYYDGGPSGLDCHIFNDKEWIAVDNNPASSFYGRIYVTWSQFILDSTGIVYSSSPIKLAYSDDRGNTFSDPIDVTGSAPNGNCPGFALNPSNSLHCVENQFSVPVVGTDGTVYVSFINGQHETPEHRDQYLVSRVHPGSGFSVDGPFLATFPVYDASDDYPTQTTGGQGRSTLCNSNFRMASTQGMAIKLDGTNPAKDQLYIAWADDRAHAGQFAGVTVMDRAHGYACPGGLNTDNDVFIIESTDQGAIWTSPRQVNQDKPANTVNDKDQFYPWVAANPKGQIVVVYLDRRYDNTPVPNKLSRATVGYTTDLVNWKETLIAQFPSNYDNAFRAGAFIGDYNHVQIMNDGTVYAVWVGVKPGKTFEGVPVLASDIFIAIYSVGK